MRETEREGTRGWCLGQMKCEHCQKRSTQKQFGPRLTEIVRVDVFHDPEVSKGAFCGRSKEQWVFEHEGRDSSERC